MLSHSKLGPKSFAASKKLYWLIAGKDICFAGNKNLKIYGLLSCKSGRRMKRENRVFFNSEREAIENDYRPCGHCMKTAYAEWKKSG